MKYEQHTRYIFSKSQKSREQRSEQASAIFVVLVQKSSKWIRQPLSFFLCLVFGAYKCADPPDGIFHWPALQNNGKSTNHSKCWWNIKSLSQTVVSIVHHECRGGPKYLDPCCLCIYRYIHFAKFPFRLTLLCHIRIKATSAKFHICLLYTSPSPRD